MSQTESAGHYTMRDPGHTTYKTVDTAPHTHTRHRHKSGEREHTHSRVVCKVYVHNVESMLRVMTRLHGQARSVSHTYIHTYTSICTLLAFSTETLPWRCCAPSRIAEPCAGGAAPSRAARTCTRRAAQRGTRGALAERHCQLCCGQVGRKHAPCAERAGQRVLGGCGAGRPAPGVIPDPMISGGAARRPSRWVGAESTAARRARWAGKPAAQAAPQAKAWRACGARSQAGVGPPSLRRKKPSGARAGAHLVPAGGAGTERRRFFVLVESPTDAD